LNMTALDRVFKSYATIAEAANSLK